MPCESIRRWNWINAFLAAALNATMEYCNNAPRNDLTFQEFISNYVNLVRDRLRCPFPDVTFELGELAYVFQLEGELWGSDWEIYTSFFPTEEHERRQPLQTFHLVLAFFTIERCLAAFQPPERKANTGRKGRRRDLFGWEHGVFSVRYPHCLEAMGPPFFLCANTSGAIGVGQATDLWLELRERPVPDRLQEFYAATSGYQHFAPILEKALINTRKDYLPKVLPKDGRRLPHGTRAWWYDVLWRYSESVRYRLIMPAPEAQERPFFWNRSIRWFTSLTITGLLTIAAESEPSVRNSWESCRRRNPVLGGVFEGVARL